MQVTWEPASSLPAAAIEEFEKQLMPEVVQHVSDDYGHTVLVPFLFRKRHVDHNQARRLEKTIPLSRVALG